MSETDTPQNPSPSELKVSSLTVVVQQDGSVAIDSSNWMFPVASVTAIGEDGKRASVCSDDSTKLSIESLFKGLTAATQTLWDRFNHGGEV